ncbi:hypothetical protein B0T10DRAFT_307393 [Thelonectria olida]|uniref:Uncharacterized protein n=1 Tax=Thelonectria olida TaxID=1576542 RepID=A0A9P8W640_9HYPO|nr:hypothetical protein B0T10DRAFT_307393 [Thelonectria olida]
MKRVLIWHGRVGSLWYLVWSSFFTSFIRAASHSSFGNTDVLIADTQTGPSYSCYQIRLKSQSCTVTECCL